LRLPLTPTLSPRAGRGRNKPLAPRERGEGGARVSGRVRGCHGLRIMISRPYRRRRRPAS
jgi:hypothetical protein